MEIRPMESTDWTDFVITQRKHDQLAYAAVNPYGHSYEPIRQLNRLHTGYSSNYLMISDPVFDGYLTKAVGSKSEDELKQILKDANEHIARQHFAIRWRWRYIENAWSGPWKIMLKGFPRSRKKKGNEWPGNYTTIPPRDFPALN